MISFPTKIEIKIWKRICITTKCSSILAEEFCSMAWLQLIVVPVVLCYDQFGVPFRLLSEKCNKSKTGKRKNNGIFFKKFIQQTKGFFSFLFFSRELAKHVEKNLQHLHKVWHTHMPLCLNWVITKMDWAGRLWWNIANINKDNRTNEEENKGNKPINSKANESWLPVMRICQGHWKML